MAHPQTHPRVQAFKALMDEYQMRPDEYDDGEEEDPRPFLSGEQTPSRFVCVTANYSSHGYGKTFFLPTFDVAADAQRRACEYAQDDVFEEVPVEVRDLDTGESYGPDWSSLRWRTLTRRTAG